METLLKYTAGGVASLLALLAPVRPLVVCALLFVAVDFATGVAASRKRARKQNLPWGFESRKAWDTVVKLAFVMAGIVMAWLIDSCMLGLIDLRLAKLFTGFVCGVEFWSYLENAAEISDHPVFLWLKRFMKKQFDQKIGDDGPRTEE